MRKVYVAGVFSTPFGKLGDASIKSLAIAAGIGAMADAKVSSEAVEHLYFGNFAAGMLQGQKMLAAVVASGLRLTLGPATAVEGACASGGIAFHLAALAVATGQCDIALAVGAEVMTGSTTEQVTNVLASAMDQASGEPLTGLTFAGFFSLLARRHMAVYGTTMDHFAYVAKKNRDNAQYNPRAQFFGHPVTWEKIQQSRLIAEPLRLYDCCPISDGASAAIIVSENVAKALGGTMIEVLASTQAAGPAALQEMDSLTSLSAVRHAAQAAYETAHVGPEDIDIAEVHDCFSAAEVIAMEDLGFCGPGEGGPYIASGSTLWDGERPVNLSGGLLSKGHPVGATGLAQVYEVVQQLRGTADRPARRARIGLTHNVGGTGGAVVINILART
ncbi:MAG: acetyl-CoA acetyltransferase [Sulfobacillus benefaciens]|uniref:propanoyl-CoA C-acyltransferase n=1 Tax=Sulfobacillus benefaciens TaxID=453960 RepID=A0A2T2XIZ0_9FIRM|nr:MAG: acetyl-CoA acetyltransferase [Sulfobacillus benefaciens]